VNISDANGKHEFSIKPSDIGYEINANCHGTTFANGEVGVRNEVAKTILEDNNFYEPLKPGEKPQQGDVGAFIDNGEYVHTVRVNSNVDGQVMVRSKSGIEALNPDINVNNSWNGPGTVTYYRPVQNAEKKE